MEMHRPLRSARPMHSRRDVLRAMGITAAAGLLVSCGGDDDDAAEEDGGGGGGVGGNFPETPEWNFVFINHVTTNPFFVPTMYGVEDASALLGTTFQWTGSERADIPRWSARSKRRSPLAPTGSPSRSSTSRRSTIRSSKPSPPGSRWCRTTPTLRTPGSPTSGRTCSGPAFRDGQADRRARRRGQGGVVHRHARTAQHPAAHRRRDRRPSRSPARTSSRRAGRDRRRRSPRSSTASRRGTSATRTPPGCSPSTPGARRRWARWSSSRAHATAASRAAAATTCCR